MQGRIGAFISVNGYYLFLLEILRTLAMKYRAIAYSRVLQYTDAKIGNRPNIRGARAISIGSKFVAGNNLWLEGVFHYESHQYTPRITIGHCVNFSNSVHIAATTGITIGNGVLVGSNVLITDHNHGRYSGDGQDDPSVRPVMRQLSSDEEVYIGDNVWIGDGVVVLPGSSIGEGSIVGANSVVASKIPPFCIVAGNPARPIKCYDSKHKEWKKWM
jgi:lipopolysaccharide O-acetyltransferase